MAKYYSGITTGTTLDSMLAGGSEFGIFPSEDIDCSNINASGIHTVGGFFYPNGGIKDSSNSTGSSGKVLSSTGSGLAWIDPSTGSTANAVNVGTNLDSTNADQFVAFMGASSGNNPVRVDAGLKYNPSTNILTVKGSEGTDAIIELNADEGDDNEDKWRIRSDATGNDLKFESYYSGSWSDGSPLKLAGNGIVTIPSQVIINKVNINQNIIQLNSGTEDLKIRGNGTGGTHHLTLDDDVTIVGDLTVQGVGGFVTGMILLWSGASNAIPSGWVLCNGSNSTPDLRDRFVVGAGSGYSVGATGGAASVTLTVNQIPAHTHTHTKATHPSGSGPEQNQSGGPEDRTNFGDTGTTGSTGGGQSHENRPPYYALCYIMKT